MDGFFFCLWQNSMAKIKPTAHSKKNSTSIHLEIYFEHGNLSQRVWKYALIWIPWERPAPGISAQSISLSHRAETTHVTQPCHKIKGSFKKRTTISIVACHASLSGDRHSNGPFSGTNGLIIMRSACWDAYMVERAELAGAGNEYQTGNMTRCHSWRIRKHAHVRYFKLY